MACKSEKRTINGHEYYVMQMPATKAIKTKLELMSYLGNSLTMLADVLFKGGSNENEAMNYLLANIAKPGFYELMERIVKEASFDNQEIVSIDATFSGNIEDFWEVALFVLEVNYKDFLQQIVSKLKQTWGKKTPSKRA